MRMKLSRQLFTIFTKLMTMFFIVIIPVYMLAIQMNDSGGRIVKDEISNSLLSQIQFYTNSFDNEIDRISRLQREYVNDNDLLSLSVVAGGLPYYEQTVMMKSFQQKLKLMKSSGIYVTKASVYILPIQSVISTDDLSETLTADDLKKLNEIRNEPLKSPLSYENGRLFLREFYPAPMLSPQRNPLFMLETEISVPQLQQFLQQILGTKMGSAVIVNEDWTLTSRADQGALAPMIENVRRWNESRGTEMSRIESVSVENEKYMVAYAYSPVTMTSLMVYMPESEVLGPLQKYKGFIILMSIVTFVIIVFVSYWGYQVIHKPLSKMVRAFRQVESGNLSIALQPRSRDEFSYLYQQFNGMISKLNTLIYEVFEGKLQTQQAELNQLQSQINPHFLYNSLYLLFRITKAGDYETSMRFTKYLGDYFQYITKKTGDQVPLEQEWHHMRMYMEIQNIRFSNRVKVAIDELPRELNAFNVPRLILQPLVENAYNYGLENTLSHGFLSVTLQRNEDAIRITIEDNGVGMPEDKLEQWNNKFMSKLVNVDVSGMMNVHRRLQLTFGGDSGLTLQHRAGGGLLVILRIDVPGKEEDHVEFNARG